MELSTYRASEGQGKGYFIRRLSSGRDPTRRASNTIYASRGMVTVRPGHFWSYNRDTAPSPYFVAEDTASGEIIGTVHPRIGHSRALQNSGARILALVPWQSTAGAPSGHRRLWCGGLVEHFQAAAAGLSWICPVMPTMSWAIALYEKARLPPGSRLSPSRGQDWGPINEKLFASPIRGL